MTFDNTSTTHRSRYESQHSSDKVVSYYSSYTRRLTACILSRHFLNFGIRVLFVSAICRNMAVSALARGMLILFFAALVLFAIGFSTAYWQKYELGLFNVHWGLWRSCAGDVCRDNSLPDASSDISWFEATQAFETLGFIAALAALVLIVLYIFVPQTSGKRIIGILSMLACFAAAGCIMLGIIIYGSKVERNLSWSFALCCIAGIIFGVSGVLLLIDMVKK